MTVAFDAFTANANQTADFSFNHTPVGTPRAVIVWIVERAATADHIAGVTYGGTAMTEVSGSPNILSTGETGIVYCYFLGTGILTGVRSVAVDTTATSNYIAYCVTLTAANDTSVIDSDGTINSTSIANPSVTLSLSSKTSWAGLALHSGQQAVTGITPLTNWTSRSETDRGTDQAACYTYNTIASTDVTAGWTQAAEDACAVCIAVTDVSAALFERACNQSISISPAISRTFIGVRAISQSITIADSLSRMKTAIRALAQSVTISDAVAEAALKLRSMADSITISDAITRIKIFPRAIAESISISDSISRLKTAIRGISQSISVSDSLTRVATKLRGISQSIGISDSVTRVATKLRAISESVTVSDSIARLKTAIRGISQSVTVSDAIQRMKTAIRGISQSITLSDALERVFIGGGGTLFEVACNVSITLSDSVSRMKTAIRDVSQSISITDSLTKSALKIRNMVESISISDALSRLKIPFSPGQLFERAINETISISDSVTILFTQFVGIITAIGGKPPGGNIFRRKFEKQREKWRRDWKVDWKAKYDKRIKNRFKRIGK